VTAEEIEDPADLDLSLTVNGTQRQSSNTKALIFDIPKLIAYASAGYRLYPGRRHHDRNAGRGRARGRWRRRDEPRDGTRNDDGEGRVLAQAGGRLAMTVIERAVASVLEFKLDRAVGGSGVAAVDVILVRLKDADGAHGLGFSYVLGGGGALCFAATEGQLARYIRGHAAAPRRAAWKTITRGFNRTGLGPNLIALAAIDMAMWDIHAHRQGVPLGVAMGGARRDVAVYGSAGFNSVQSEGDAAEAAAAYVARGLRAVKPRVAGVPKDERVVKAVRQAVGDDVTLMADANEKCVSSPQTAFWASPGTTVSFSWKSRFHGRRSARTHS
jgi:hypothetical protein